MGRNTEHCGHDDDGNDQSDCEADKPAASFRYPSTAGVIEVAVWAHEVQRDKESFVTHSVTCSRSYKDDKGWHRAAGLKAADIPVLIIALQKAFEWVAESKKNGGNGENAPF